MTENRRHHPSDFPLPLQQAELAELVAPDQRRQPQRAQVLPEVIGAVTQTAWVMKWASAME